MRLKLTAFSFKLTTSFDDKAEMKVYMALDEEGLEKGMVLTCQALPVTKTIAVEF